LRSMAQDQESGERGCHADRGRERLILLGEPPPSLHPAMGAQCPTRCPRRTECNMDHIIGANLTLLDGQFVGEDDFTRRDQLKKLLIDEENKLGRRTERLEQVLRQIGRCTARLRTWKASSNSRGPTDARLGRPSRYCAICVSFIACTRTTARRSSTD
jgi:bacterioferritin (cytochrome b1)